MGACTSSPKVVDGEHYLSTMKHCAPQRDSIDDYDRPLGIIETIKAIPDNNHNIPTISTVVPNAAPATGFPVSISPRSERRRVHISRNDTPIITASPKASKVLTTAQSTPRHDCPGWYYEIATVGSQRRKNDKSKANNSILKRASSLADMKNVFSSSSNSKSSRCCNSTILEVSARRVARHQSNRRILADRLRSIETGLPSSSPKASQVPTDQFDEKNVDGSYVVPEAPKQLASLYSQAMKDMDTEYASQDTMQQLLANNVAFSAPDGSFVRGKGAAIDRMNEGMQSVVDSIQSAASTFGGTLDSLKKNVKITISSPKRTSKGTWIVIYQFEVMMRKSKVSDEFTINKHGLVKQLARVRM